MLSEIGYSKKAHRNILPRSVAYLGELGRCVVWHPFKESFFELPYKPGRVLCASPDGRELFALRPVSDTKRFKARENDQMLEAMNLNERWMNRDAEGFYNLRVPALRKPDYIGELVIMQYLSDKNIDADDEDEEEDDSDEDEEEDEDDAELEPLESYEHYFEKPGSRPAYVTICSIGHDQLWIPPGEFEVAAEGIRYAPKQG